jgi:general secretion pathway protein G
MHRHLYEILFVFVLIAVVATLLLRRAAELSAQAEAVQVTRTLSYIETAARMRIAESIMRGTTADIPAMARENPANWLDPSSGMTIGACPAAPGGWCFDGQRLAYRYASDPERIDAWRLRFRSDPPRDLVLAPLPAPQETESPRR